MTAIAIDIQKSAAWIAAHRLDLRTDAGKQIANLIAEAIQAERKQNQEAAEIERANLMEAIDDAAKNAFEMGEFAERLRALGLVKAWGRGLNGSEYLSRSIGLLFDQIKRGLPNPAVSVPIHPETTQPQARHRLAEETIPTSAALHTSRSQAGHSGDTGREQPVRAGFSSSCSSLEHSELLTTIKEFAHWHHLNEVTITAGKTPSDSEIDFEATAWNKIRRVIATATATSAPVDDYSRGMRAALKYLDDARRSSLPNMSKVLDGAIDHLRRQTTRQGSTEA